MDDNNSDNNSNNTLKTPGTVGDDRTSDPPLDDKTKMAINIVTALVTLSGMVWIARNVFGRRI